MNLFDFKLLPENEQIDLLYKEGIYIGKRKVNNQDAVLYQFEAFYAEIYYREYRKYISRIFCFSSTTLLDPYLEQIVVVNLV